MPIRNSVFGSNAERRLFDVLESRWTNDVYRLVSGLHISSILERRREDLDDRLWSFYLKTEVDYTLCERATGRPILSVEFDGMGGGHVRGGRYIQYRETIDPRRLEKLDTKLRLAREDGYPLFVVSYPEAERIDTPLALLCVDGLIGQTLAHIASLQRTRPRVAQQKEDIARLPIEAAITRIQAAFDEESVSAEWEKNPIAREASELVSSAMRLGLMPDDCYRGSSITPEALKDLRLDAKEIVESFHHSVVIYDPRAPTRVIEITDEDYARMMPQLLRIGTRFTIETSARVIEKAVWMRNIFLGEHIPQSPQQASARWIEIPRPSGEASAFLSPKTLIDPARLTNYMAQVASFRELLRTHAGKPDAR